MDVDEFGLVIPQVDRHERLELGDLAGLGLVPELDDFGDGILGGGPAGIGDIEVEVIDKRTSGASLDCAGGEASGWFGVSV